MSELKRYTPYDGDSSLYSDSKRGGWVKYEDHISATSDLRRELERVKQEGDELKRRLSTAMQTIDDLNQAYIDENI